MRIWHEQLISKLCRPHLLAMWREGLGAYKIITENKNGYRNHPAVKEFKDNTGLLAGRLLLTRNEMLKRGYNPKPLSTIKIDHLFMLNIVLGGSSEVKNPWQTLEQQVEVLKSKKCQCKV